ncbi:D-erythrulose reductase-like [Mytilus californianus]|uniref:D-erythrulose reductase-like n=1 Tax=Mytilus californianus TaxID=6549 RepID=UPI0022467D87|nr:D-erythrulose reductase-like [Mytilus californianus]
MGNFLIRFDGKRALVTGAGKGIGRAIAKKLAECGAETFALIRTQTDLDSLMSHQKPNKVINVDLQDWDKTREEVSKTGNINLLVNNAGIIRVNSINPSVGWTDMTRPIKDFLIPLLFKTPLGRFPEIADVVNAVVFLLSDQSGMISGESLRVDRGLSVH